MYAKDSSYVKRLAISYGDGGIDQSDWLVVMEQTIAVARQDQHAEFTTRSSDMNHPQGYLVDISAATYATSEYVSECSSPSSQSSGDDFCLGWEPGYLQNSVRSKLDGVQC